MDHDDYWIDFDHFRGHSFDAADQLISKRGRFEKDIKRDVRPPPENPEGERRDEKRATKHQVEDWKAIEKVS